MLQIHLTHALLFPSLSTRYSDVAHPESCHALRPDQQQIVEPALALLKTLNPRSVTVTVDPASNLITISAAALRCALLTEHMTTLKDMSFCLHVHVFPAELRLVFSPDADARSATWPSGSRSIAGTAM